MCSSRYKMIYLLARTPLTRSTTKPGLSTQNWVVLNSQTHTDIHTDIQADRHRETCRRRYHLARLYCKICRAWRNKAICVPTDRPIHSNLTSPFNSCAFYLVKLENKKKEQLNCILGSMNIASCHYSSAFYCSLLCVSVLIN